MAIKVAQVYRAEGSEPCWEALPCPFCGWVPSIAPWHGGDTGQKVMISCLYPRCHVAPSVTGSRRRQAVSRWNTRAEP